MKKLLSTLLAVLLAVTMLTDMAIPAQAAENDIFNPGVLELDGSRTFTISKTKSSAFFSFTPETTGCYEFRIQNRKLKDVDVDFGIMDNYAMMLTSAEEVDAARYRGVSDTLATAMTLQAGERYLIYFIAYNQEQWERPVDFNVNVGMHTHDVIKGDIKATHYDDGENYKLCKYCDEYKGYMNDYNAYQTVALSKTSYTYDGKEKFNSVMGIKTSKKDKELHGYGIKSIRHMVESVDGDFEIHTKEEWFVADVVIPLV